MQPKQLISCPSVVFKLEDAACPDLTETVRAIGPELQVAGSVVYFSDGCHRKNHFAIVEVAGIHTPLIVPVDRLEWVARPAEEQPWPVSEDSSRQAC